MNIRRNIAALAFAAIYACASASTVMHVYTKSGKFYSSSVKTNTVNTTAMGYISDGLTHMWDSQIPNGYNRETRYDTFDFDVNTSHLISTNATWRDIVGGINLTLIRGSTNTYFEAFADKGKETLDGHIFGHALFIGDAESVAWCETLPTGDCVTVEIAYVPSGDAPQFVSQSSYAPDGSEYFTYLSTGMDNESVLNSQSSMHNGITADIASYHTIGAVACGARGNYIQGWWGRNTGYVIHTGIVSTVSSPSYVMNGSAGDLYHAPGYLCSISGWQAEYKPNYARSFWSNGRLSQTCYARTVSHSIGSWTDGADRSSIGMWNGSSTNFYASTESYPYFANSGGALRIDGIPFYHDDSYTFADIGPARPIPAFTIGASLAFQQASIVTNEFDGRDLHYIQYSYTFPEPSPSLIRGCSPNCTYLSVRTYSRVLSDEERQHNFLIDTKRFRTVR